MQRVALTVLAFSATLTTGCDALSLLSALSTSNVTVEVTLVNSATSDVEVTLYIDDDQDTVEFLLQEVGERLDFVIPAGESESFVRSCDDLQAIMIEDADLLVIGGIGPETNTGILRDGDDFRCGDEIEFTFSNSSLIVDFDVTVDVR